MCVHKQESTDAHRYMCAHVYMVCVCVCVVLHSGDGVEGVCPRACSLSSLYKGPVCSPWWLLTQCLSSSPVRALCPATRPVNTHTHTCTSPALPQPDYDTRTHAHAHAHAHHQHPGKADLSLSWITDIYMAPCSQNNLIPLTPSLRVYNKAYVCVRFLSDSV